MPRDDSRVRIFVLQDYKENRKKCTVWPLRARSDVELVRIRRPPAPEEPIPVGRGVCLSIGAPHLSLDDRRWLSPDGCLLLLDSSWARVPVLARRIVGEPGALHHRSLPDGIRTAYPRRSKLFDDPEGGLASVEALFAATAIVGIPRFDLLDHYRWADQFLELNAKRFEQWGVSFATPS